MFALIPIQRWTPTDQSRWSLRAYGREVMLESSGGALGADLGQLAARAALKLHGRVVGRMLIEAYCNGEQVLEELRSNEDFEIALDLTGFVGLKASQLEVLFIPATYGEIRIPRAIPTGNQGEQTAPFGLGCEVKALART